MTFEVQWIKHEADDKLAGIPYFSVAVLKHHGQGNLRRKELAWTYGAGGIIVHHVGRYDSACRFGGGSRELRVHVFSD